MDYCVKDSSLYRDAHSVAAAYKTDCAVRFGQVREERVDKNGEVTYLVEVMNGGRQIPVVCKPTVRFGGPHNFEEYKLRPWATFAASGMLAPATAGVPETRAGDRVLVAFIEGSSREGVIIGCIGHPTSKPVIKEQDIEYISRFNGLETQIRKDGSYKMIFKGLPVNDALLNIPSMGNPVPPPIFNPLIAGSFYGFDGKGSYVASDGAQYLKITKNKVSGSIVLVSGKNRIDLGGNAAIGKMGFQTDNIAFEAKQMSIKSTMSYKMQSLAVSMKATTMAIGSDQFELFDGLVKLIDGLGELVITSPVGTCTPFKLAPQWTAKIEPLKAMIKTLVSSLKDPDPVEKSDDGGIDLGTDVGG